MENRLVGVGKVSHGRMTFTAANGVGFSHSIKHNTAIHEEVTAPPYEGLDVPYFMKNRKRTPRINNVIHVDFPQQEKQDKGEKIVDSIVHVGQWLLRPIKNYFFTEEDK